MTQRLCWPAQRVEPVYQYWTIEGEVGHTTFSTLEASVFWCWSCSVVDICLSAWLDRTERLLLLLLICD